MDCGSLIVALVARLQSILTVYPPTRPRKWPLITVFFNPEIPGLSRDNPGISGLEK